MSINLIELSKQLFTGEVLSKSGAALGESESAISKLVQAGVPTILLGLLSKSSSMGQGGLMTLLNSAKSLFQGGSSSIASSIPQLMNSFSSNPQGFAGIINSLFGDKANAVTQSLAQYANVKPASAQALLATAAPAVLAEVNNKASEGNWTESGIWTWLSSQKDTLLNMLPSGLGIGSLLGMSSSTAHASTTTTASHNTARVTTANTPEHTPEPQKRNGLVWIIMLLAAAFVAWFMLKDGCNKKDTTTDTTITHNDTAVVKTTTTTTTTTTRAGELDASGNWIYETGDKTTIKLVDGTELEVGANSTENKLYNFITSGTIDTDDKTANWITCDRVYFETGKSVLTAESQLQVKNIGAILRNFPSASIKLGGYTDNTGDAAINTKLSKERAEIVGKELLKAGAAASQVKEAEGYGPEFPIASNDTDEGKAQNRRVDLKVASK
jgi:OOP family OmpA-OmpF porin